MILKDKIYIDTSELGYQISKICELFTYKNPEIFHKKRLKLSIKNVAPYLYHYKIEDTNGKKTLQLPRGGLHKLTKFFKDLDSSFRIADCRISLPEIDVTLVDTVLEEQQLKIIDTLIKNDGGLIQASPGAGKTVGILGTIAQIKQPTLILVHEHRLSMQWMEEIKKRLSGNFKLGKYDGDRKEDGDIVVGIINSVYTRYLEDPSFFDKFGMVVVDEVQHQPSEMLLKVVNNTSAKYRIGVTGTVNRRDGNEILTYDVIGPLLLKIDSQDLKHRITDFEYKIVNTNIRSEIPTIFRWTGKKRENVLDMAKNLTKIVENKERNDIILNETIWCIENGYFPLILSDRIAHNELLHERICGFGYKAVLLIGKTRKKTKWEEIRKDRSIQCIVANSKIASEGLDLPELSALLLTCPTTNVHKLKQQIGRIRRICDGKPTPLVIDFCDNLAYLQTDEGIKHIFHYAANTRRNFYNQLKSEYYS